MRTDIFLERTFDTPLSATDVLEGGRSSAWCFDLHKMSWQCSFLAAGGRKLVCWFAAPDAESARLAFRLAGADMRRMWPGTVHDGPGGAVPNVVVERSFAEPVRLKDMQALADASQWCLRAHNVLYFRTFFSFDRKRMLCLYEAPDAESVRTAQREAAMPVDAVWACSRITPGAPAPSA